MSRLANFVEETVSVGGAGDLTLGGAATNKVTINEAVGLNCLFNYVIKDGANQELGIGRITTSTNFVRVLVQQTIVSGVNDFTSPTPITVSTSATVMIATGVQGIMGAHSGFYFASSGVNGLMSFGNVNAGGTSYSGLNGFLNMNPFYLACSKYISVCSLHVVGTAGGAAVKVGLWEKATNGKPGYLLIDFTGAGSIDCSTATHKSATAATGKFLSAGDYYIGVVGNNSSISLKGPQYSPSALDLGMNSTGSAITNIFRAYTYGALPTGDESTQTYTENTTIHSFWLR